MFDHHIAITDSGEGNHREIDSFFQCRKNTEKAEQDRPKPDADGVGHKQFKLAFEQIGGEAEPQKKLSRKRKSSK